VTSASGQLVERERELAALDALLAGARDGHGSAVLLEGEAGIGKSTLLAAAADSARHAGMRVLTASGSPLEEGVAHGVTRELLLEALPHEGPERERLLTGAAGLATPALSPGGAAAGDESAFGVRHGLTWLVAALADTGPAMALVVDDLHWVDGPSARFLAALATRVDEMPIALLLAARPPAAWTDADLAAEIGASAPLLQPARLSPDGVRSSLARRLGVEPDEAFAAAAHAETAGTPYLVTALAQALTREDIAPTAEHAAGIRSLGSAEIGRTVAARVRGLPAEAQAIVRAIAILGGGRPAGEAERLAGTEPGAAVRAAQALEGLGLVHGWPAPVFDHPLVRAAVLDDLGAADAADLHARAADMARLSGDTERAAAHLAQTPGRGDADRVDLLLGVGTRARQTGAPEVALRHLVRALDEPAADHQQTPVLFELGLTELGLGIPTAPDRFAAAATAAADPDLRLRAQVVSGHALMFNGRWHEAFDRLHAAIAGAAGASADALAFARIELAGDMLTCISTGPEARALIEQLDRELAPDAPLRPLLEGVIALDTATRAQPRDAVLRHVIASSGPLTPEQETSPVRPSPMLALMLIDAFEHVGPAIESLLYARRRGGDLTGVRMLSAWQALSRVREGRLAEAEEALLGVEEGEGPPPPIAEVVGAIARANVALDRGDVVAADAATSAPLEHDPRISETNLCDEYLICRGRVLLARGDREAALGIFEGASASHTRWGGESPPTAQWRLWTAYGRDALGHRDDARQLAAEELAVAQRLGAPRPIAMALLAQASFAAESAEAERALRDALDVLAGALPLQRANIEANLGELLLRSDRVAEGQERLRAALELAWTAGADALTTRVRGLLAESGARPRRAERTGVHALTAAEARTARMAAEMTNREIAEALFVTEKTVETHLTATYRKLNIGGRAHLAAALALDLGSQGLPL
jgi:DNA-binding CsgD family transcriptional regulator